jgi:MFS family permease
VPLYLAECLPAEQRGRGAALFQLLLTIGLVGAAVIGLSQAHSVEVATQAAASLAPAARAQAVFQARDHAWRGIFWICLGPGIVFTLGSLALKESPRWLALRPAPQEARLRAVETGSLLNRRYVLPFALLGSGGIVIALLVAGLLFHSSEAGQRDVRASIEARPVNALHSCILSL